MNTRTLRNSDMDHIAEDVYTALKQKDNSSALETLLKAGLAADNVFTSREFPDVHGKSFLQICCSDNNVANIDMLVKYGCHVDYCVKEVISTQTRTFQLNTNVRDLTHTCLYYAICTAKDLVVSSLINAGADVTLKCTDDVTCLMHAVDIGNLSIVRTICEVRNCDINAQDIYGLSALHIAVIHGRSDIVEYLLKRRARVDLQQCQGGTPLFMVSDKKTLSLLMEYGSDPNHEAEQNVTGLSCLVMRSQDSQCVFDLLNAGARVPIQFLHDIERRPPPLMEKDPNLRAIMRRHASQPVSLKLQAAHVIRKSLLEASHGVGLDVFRRCELLPIPKILKLYIRNFGLTSY